VHPADLDVILLVGAVIVIAAIAAVRVSHGVGLPGLLVFLGLGLALGESGAGIQFDDAGLAEALGLCALILILAEGGLTTDLAQARAGAGPALALATAGVVVTAAVVAGAAHWFLAMSWHQALLLGAVLAPTDAAAVFSVLRRLPLPPRLSGILEGESGLNDPPSVLAVTLLSAVGAHPSAGFVVAEVLYELAVGGAIGLVVGLAGAAGLRRVALPASGLYPLAVFALVVAGYGAASSVHASGFLAVYVSALVLGNVRLPHRAATRGFAEGVAWLAQIGLFVMLGLLASPSQLPAQIWPAIVIGLILTLVARPVAVLLSTVGFRVPWREKAFVSYAGLRGAVPIVLATIPLSAAIPGSVRLFDLVFLIVGVFTLVQGPTLPAVAKRLRVFAATEASRLDIESAPLEDLHADVLQLEIPEGSRLHGVELFELRLPQGASLSLVVRHGQGFVPDRTTRLQEGDRLLIVVAAPARKETERRLRAVSRAGKLAGWFGERGH
jgi:cell volume regulation protein A